ATVPTGCPSSGDSRGNGHAAVDPSRSEEGTRRPGVERPGRRHRPPLRRSHRLRTRPRWQALRPEGRRGLACRYHLGRVLQPEEFSGGEAPGQANFVLRKLGFTVIRKGEPAEEEKPAPKDWTQQEVGLIVADYFTMLEKELLGKEYSKAAHRRSLA